MGALANVIDDSNLKILIALNFDIWAIPKSIFLQFRVFGYFNKGEGGATYESTTSY